MAVAAVALAKGDVPPKRAESKGPLPCGPFSGASGALHLCVVHSHVGGSLDVGLELRRNDRAFFEHGADVLHDVSDHAGWCGRRAALPMPRHMSLFTLAKVTL